MQLIYYQYSSGCHYSTASIALHSILGGELISLVKVPELKLPGVAEMHVLNWERKKMLSLVL